MADLKSQAYIFFLLNVEGDWFTCSSPEPNSCNTYLLYPFLDGIYAGWKIAASQQISQLQLEGFLVKIEYNQVKQRSSMTDQNSSGQVLMSLQESAMSIFTQYFSENVFFLLFFVPY